MLMHCAHARYYRYSSFLQNISPSVILCDLTVRGSSSFGNLGEGQASQSEVWDWGVVGGMKALIRDIRGPIMSAITHNLTPG